MFQIPAGWEETVAEYIKKTTNENRSRLLASDFPGGQCVSVIFEDGSNCFFRYAIAISQGTGRNRKYLVCTEHCGYFVFEGGGTEVRVLGDVK